MKTALFLLFFLFFAFTTASALPAEEFLYDDENKKAEENGVYNILSATSTGHSYRQQGSGSRKIDNQRLRRPPPLTQPSPPPPRPPGFDSFLLALQWPNAFCKSPNKNCRPSPPKQYFTIHGLWPQSNTGQSLLDCAAECPLKEDIFQKLRTDLLQFWPQLLNAGDFNSGKQFWSYEWTKHGTCSSNEFPTERYLRTTIDLRKRYAPLILEVLINAGIKPDGTTTYQSRTVLDAVKNAIGASAIITCNRDRTNKLQLQEIRLCVKADGVTLDSCTTTSSTCNAGFIFASA